MSDGFNPSGKTILFPEVKTFRELFVSATKYDSKKSGKDRATAGSVELNRYCSHHRQRSIRSMSVVPTTDLVVEVTKSLIDVDGGCYWQLTDRGDNETLVSCQYQSIIGSRWIALIRTDSIPRIR